MRIKQLNKKNDNAFKDFEGHSSIKNNQVQYSTRFKFVTHSSIQKFQAQYCTRMEFVTHSSMPKVEELKELRSVLIALPVVHHKDFKLFGVVDNKFLETIRKIVAGLLVRAIANIWHQGDTLELPSDPGINTLRPSPVCL